MIHQKEAAVHQRKQRHLFTAEEDLMLQQLMCHSFSSWVAVAAQMPGRTARQCRDRWVNYLNPENKNGTWTEREDQRLVELVRQLGPQWSAISKKFDGRSENNVKNRWYTHLRRKYQADFMDNSSQVTSRKPRYIIPPINVLDQMNHIKFPVPFYSFKQ